MYGFIIEERKLEIKQWFTAKKKLIYFLKPSIMRNIVKNMIMG